MSNFYSVPRWPLVKKLANDNGLPLEREEKKARRFLRQHDRQFTWSNTIGVSNIIILYLFLKPRRF